MLLVKRGAARHARGTEAISVLARARADAAGERAAHASRRVPKPAARAMSSTREAGRLEQPPRDLDAHASRRTRPACTPTSSRNTRAKWRGLIATRAGEPLDAVVAVGMLGDPALQLARSDRARRSAPELRAELRLAARPLHEQHELARGHAARRRGRGRRRRARARGPCPRSRRPTSTRCRRARRSGRGRR